MNCQKCGAELAPGAKFCETCGTPVSNAAGIKRSATGSASAESVRPVRTEGTASNRNARPNNGDFDLGVHFDTKKIRKWFRGTQLGWPIFIAVIGLIMTYIGKELAIYDDKFRSCKIWGIIFLIGGIALGVYAWMSTVDASVVDQAWNAYIKLLPKRGLRKLNLIQEQVGIIKPIVLAGYGETPDSSFFSAKIQAQKNIKDILAILIRRIKGMDWDPYEAIRIGRDDITRSMLLSVSVYMFSEEQLLIYIGNVDISTGIIYSERTEEVFYKDIDGIQMKETLFKAYSAKQKKYVNKSREKIVLYLSGCTLQTNYRTDLKSSRIKQEFAAMRNLIRDKKNS